MVLVTVAFLCLCSSLFLCFSPVLCLFDPCFLACSSLVLVSSLSFFFSCSRSLYFAFVFPLSLSAQPLAFFCSSSPRFCYSSSVFFIFFTCPAFSLGSLFPVFLQSFLFVSFGSLSLSSVLLLFSSFSSVSWLPFPPSFLPPFSSFSLAFIKPENMVIRVSHVRPCVPWSAITALLPKRSWATKKVEHLIQKGRRSQLEMATFILDLEFWKVL